MRRGPRSLLSAVLAAMPLTLLASLQAGVAHADDSFAPGTGRPFASTSPFNTLIPANPVLDPNSAAIAGVLAGGGHAAAMEQYGVPIYSADASTPKVAVPCTEPWGVCPTGTPVPIPAGARPSPGSDGAMAIVDWSTRTVYEYWQYRSTSTGPVTSWSHKQSIDGDGAQGGAVGAGVSRLAGIVRTYEVERGEIPHALVFGTDVACPTVFRAPATGTDGRNLAGLQPCLPEGARIQLDPSVNVDALPGLTPVERMVGRALQKYGAYNIDNSGARVALIVETPYGKPDPYPAAGWTWGDYGQLNLPWNQVRTLAHWTGGGGAVGTPTPNPTPTPPPTLTPTPTPAPTATPRDTTAPAVVTGLRITGTTNRSVSLAWNATTDNVGVSKYTVWRGDANYANWVQVGTTTAGTRTFRDGTVRARTTYTYGVRAIDAANNISDGSNVVRVITK